MRSFEERKAEVLRRSAYAIEERKINIRSTLIICATIVMCITTVMTMTVLPGMKKGNVTQGGIVGNGNLSYGDAAGDIKTSSGVLDSPCITDVECTTPAPNVAESEKFSDASPDDVITGEQYSNSASVSSPNYSNSINDNDTAQKIYDVITAIIRNNNKTNRKNSGIALTLEYNGSTTVYLLNDGIIEYIGGAFSATDEQWNELMSLLGMKTGE